MNDDAAAVRAVVEARGLASLMNDTKWKELVEAVYAQLPFPPAFQLKTVLAEAPYPEKFDEDVDYHGDWDYGLTPFYAVEWIRVRPRFLRHRGRLLKPEIEDIGPAFVAVLKDLGIPHTIETGTVRIVGYAASTTGLER